MRTVRLWRPFGQFVQRTVSAPESPSYVQTRASTGSRVREWGITTTLWYPSDKIHKRHAPENVYAASRLPGNEWHTHTHKARTSPHQSCIQKSSSRVHTNTRVKIGRGAPELAATTYHTAQAREKYSKAQCSLRGGGSQKRSGATQAIRGFSGTGTTFFFF